MYEMNWEKIRIGMAYLENIIATEESEVYEEGLQGLADEIEALQALAAESLGNEVVFPAVTYELSDGDIVVEDAVGVD